MNYISRISVFTLVASTFIGSASCTNKVQSIEKFSSDSADVFASIIPQDPTERPITYKGIPVVTLKDSIPTENSEIYINLNFTILDQNLEITDDLLNFGLYNLADTGFFYTPDSVCSEKYRFVFIGMSSQEAAERLANIASKEFYEELPTILTYECGFNIDINVYPVFLNSEYVTYYKNAYCYTGGANGNSVLTLQTYNSNTGKALDIKDIIKPDKLIKLRETVAAHMASSYPIYEGISTVQQYLDSLNQWRGATDLDRVPEHASSNNIELITLKNYPIGDLGITAEGLVFCYPKYFLTPGSDGCPVIVVKYDEIRDCLKSPFNCY